MPYIYRKGGREAMTASETREGTGPKRIQLKRTKGWKMPPNTVKVTRPGKWGNQFKVGEPFESIDDGGNVDRFICENAAEAVECYRNYIESQFGMDLLAEAQSELRGKNLACWCKPGDLCHADVLLEIANTEAARSVISTEHSE
jgi:hypothetical protein